VSVYEGHGVTLHHGDCLDVLRTLPDASVDSVVTDPPYGLEFMGKDWDAPWKDPAAKFRTGTAADEGFRVTRGSLPDAYRAGAPFQRWCELWTAECLRVLKPGGHLLAFGGTRTWHRLACAVEDAGFEVRDSIAWMYGCLSDDTEILTSEGWVRYDRAKEGQHALAFDTATGALAWQAIQHVHRYPYAGEMVRLHSEHTDQLLTPNHRVVLDEGRSTPHTPYVPSDQDLRRLLADVPGARPLPVGAEADVLAGVRGSADLAAEEGQGQASLGAGRPHGAVRDVRDGDVEAGRLAQADRGGVLLEPVQRRAPGGGVGEALPQGQGGLDRRQPGVPSGEDDRAEQPRMEGRRYRVQEARELRRSALRASAGMGATDGPQGRVHHGAPATDGRPLRVPADPAGSHQPREPRPQGQPTGEPDPLALEPSAQALRVGEDGGGRLLPSTGVTADVVDYAGVVWCITVPHGAFIARRNGLIFATGNSGFPKSLDVSKAIDKAAGVEREVVGVRTLTGTAASSSAHVGNLGGGSGVGASKEVSVTAPATPDAERWQGWGTALKPAFEPVVVARKPLIGTVAATVLEHGTGALNIDGCRVGMSDADRDRLTEWHAKYGGTKYADGDTYAKGMGDIQPPHAKGRWPANVVLDESHEPVLRLRYNLPTEVERTIRESFGASTDHLPAVRDTRDGAAEQGQASEVLLPQVPGALDVGEPDGRARPEVGQAAHAGDSGADLGDQEGQPSHGREGRELEGRALPQSGVRLREVVDAPAERAGDLRADGDPQRRDLHTGAPASRGAATRAGADLRGDRAPRERTQGGQPAGEPGTPRVEQLAPDEARRGRRRDVPAATGERTTPGSPLEVLRRECPPGWWRHFDVIGHRREGQAAALDEQSGESTSQGGSRTASRGATQGASNGGMQGGYNLGAGGDYQPYGDSGGASRFFYVAKADASERPRVNGTAHPTVKPLSLMRWLVRLVTPPGGTVLEPFAGSGTTVEACIIEGFDCIAIEKGDEYLPLIMQRIHRRRDPVAAIRQTGDELGLFELDGEGA
jgi:DNA modification methylase